MNFPATATDLEEIVSAFELAAQNGPVDLADYLPPATSELYLEALRELVRVDMELAWKSGRRLMVDDYMQRFPVLHTDPIGLSEICFEEYRLRQQMGENPDGTDYHSRFSIDTSHWPPSHAGERALMQSANSYLENLVTGHLNLEAAHDAPTRLFAELHKTDPDAARNLAEALTNFPAVGQSIAGYDLLDELGSGAFSRVYLARERAVDGRRVALKITGDMRSEVRALARLRHTNIVPVYSVKQSGPFHAICMPYCGSVTLADINRKRVKEKPSPTSGQWIVRIIDRNRTEADNPLLRQLSRSTFVEAVLELSIRLARGLAHAHDRGICHRDIKPANILLADDGEPLLLDFNLAAELQTRGSAISAYIGGTLPYMAPEQLLALSGSAHDISSSADIYSLGLVLYELLAGQLPFELPTGTVDQIITQLIAARSQPIANLHQISPEVTPSLAAIIAKCLAPDAKQRYSSARELVDDLVCQREHEPLRHAPDPSWRERFTKWTKRHPRLSSGTAVSIMAGLALMSLGLALSSIHRDRTAIAERENVRQFLDEFQVARLALSHPDPDPESLSRGLKSAANAWNRIPVDSYTLSKERGQLAFLQAQSAGRQAQSQSVDREKHLAEAEQWNHAAQNLLGRDSPLLTNQAEWLAQLRSHREPTIAPPEMASTGDLELGLICLHRARNREAIEHLIDATKVDPHSVSAWFVRGMAEQRLGRLRNAESSLTTCIALNPQLPDGYFGRALVLQALGRHQEAITNFDKVLELNPDSFAARLNRGISRFELKDYVSAESDVSAAIEGGYPETRLYFIRARIRERAGNRNGAAADRQQGIELDPLTEDDWLSRSVARLPANAKEALNDLDSCIERFPQSHRAWENRAHIFDAILHEPTKAIEALNEAIRINPQSGLALAGRGVLRARRGEFAGARQDAMAALRSISSSNDVVAKDFDERPDIVYQVAGIYALTSKDKPTDLDRCLYLLQRAVQQDYGIDLIGIDPELVSIRSLPEVQRLVREAKTWQKPKTNGGMAN